MYYILSASLIGVNVWLEQVSGLEVIQSKQENNSLKITFQSERIAVQTRVAEQPVPYSTKMVNNGNIIGK